MILALSVHPSRFPDLLAPDRRHEVFFLLDLQLVPIQRQFAVAGRSKNSGQAYAFMTKWVKVAFAHGEDVFVEKLGKEEKEKYQEARKALLPRVAKLDEITGQMLLPARAEEQTALVIDAKWGSKQWHKAMPTADKANPTFAAGRRRSRKTSQPSPMLTNGARK